MPSRDSGRALSNRLDLILYCLFIPALLRFVQVALHRRDRFWNALPREAADFWVENCAPGWFVSNDRRPAKEATKK